MSPLHVRQVRHFTAAFETSVIGKSLDVMQSRIDDVRRLNRSMTSHYDDVVAQLARMRRVLDDQYAHAHDDIRSVAELAARLGAATTTTPRAAVRLTLSERTGSDVTRSTMTSLRKAADELGRASVDAGAAWQATKATVSDIWRAMMNDDVTLRNFYLNVYNDVNDVTSRAGRSVYAQCHHITRHV